MTARRQRRLSLDPDRLRRALPPTASLEEHIDDFVGWMIAGGFPPKDAGADGEQGPPSNAR